jgi:hypothetical protein
MINNIFANTAPAYWNAGLPVIPLNKASKIPAVTNWQTPSQDPQLLTDYADGNIGLLLGEVSGIEVLDIDVNCDLSAFIQTALEGTTSWIRCGHKGKALAFKFNHTAPFLIKSKAGKVVCELISNRRQLALAPSLHPTSLQPYVENYPLYEASLKPLPDNIEETLRKVVADYEEIYGAI